MMHLSTFNYLTCALPFVNIFSDLQEVKHMRSQDVGLLLLIAMYQLQCQPLKGSTSWLGSIWITVKSRSTPTISR